MNLMAPSAGNSTDVVRRQRVLVVDNEVASRAESTVAMRSLGHVVSEATDAEEGRSMAALVRPDLIICNLSPQTQGVGDDSTGHDRPAIMFRPDAPRRDSKQPRRGRLTAPD